jgi:predicted nucleic acid-binding protein
MPLLYFDTSALVKRYHSEKGSVYVDSAFSDASNDIVIGRHAVAETISAFALKVRTGHLSFTAMEAARKRLLADIGSKRIRVVRIRQSHFARCEKLLAHWGPLQPLRMLDALHLSLALDLHENTTLDGFVGADIGLNKIVVLEGLLLINPETI